MARVNLTETNWTAYCQPGWSNIGMFHYPPSDPTKCFTNIQAINAIYGVGFVANVFSVGVGIKAMLRLARRRSERGLWVCFILATYYCMNNLGIISARLVLTHEEEILGRPQMQPFFVFYISIGVTFWTAIYAFLYKYMDYIKTTCKMSAMLSGRPVLKRVVFGYVLGTLCSVCMSCLWGYVAFGPEAEIAQRSLVAAIFLDVTVTLSSLVIWPSVSFTLVRDLRSLVNESTNSSSILVLRAKASLMKMKLFTILVSASGGQSMVSIVVALVLPDFARVLPYLMTARVLILCPVLLCIVISILSPSEEGSKQSQPTAGTTHMKIAPEQTAESSAVMLFTDVESEMKF